jgi:hypothetical protein
MTRCFTCPQTIEIVMQTRIGVVPLLVPFGKKGEYYAWLMTARTIAVAEARLVNSFNFDVRSLRKAGRAPDRRASVMTHEGRIQELIEDILDSDCTPEEICKDFRATWLPNKRSGRPPRLDRSLTFMPWGQSSMKCDWPATISRGHSPGNRAASHCRGPSTP